MPLLIFAALLFVLLGLLWVIGAGVLFGVALSNTRPTLDRILDHRGGRCACRFPLRDHTS